MNVGREKIEYYATQKTAEKGERASGTIDLVNLKAVKKFDNLTFQLECGPDGVYLLRAETNAELAIWMTGLETYLKEKMVSLSCHQCHSPFVKNNLSSKG